jgi:arginyl-tRNA synthetase
MNLELIIENRVRDAINALYSYNPEKGFIQIQATRKEFEGDLTVVIFPLLRISKKSPETTGNEIGEFIKSKSAEIDKFNVVKGFLNLKLSNDFWLSALNEALGNKNFGTAAESGKCVMVEFSSPNTNKPLHLGHIRNNLLGSSVANLLEANGHKVIKVNLVNDRGIHICKSMLAWKLFGNGETPASSGMKGDHLVGKYYVVFDKAYKAEIKELMEKGMTEEEAKKSAPLILEAQKMLLAWEQNDAEVVTIPCTNLTCTDKVFFKIVHSSLVA